jgi:hypothetical protein
MSLGSQPLSGAAGLSARLEEHGYAVFENAASSEWSASVARDIAGLHARDLLQRSLNRVATSRGEQGSSGAPAPPPTGEVCEKAGVYEQDLLLNGAVLHPQALAAAASLQSWVDACGPTALLAQLNAAAPWLALTHLDTLKVQLNEGLGGCFPLHFDTTPETSSRTLTAILYLSTAWTVAAGGQLRLHPFPLAPVDIEPQAGRLVVFSSTALLHRVLPAHARRCVLSLWFSGQHKRPFPSRYPGWVSQQDAQTAQLLAFLRCPVNARLLCKVLLCDDWARSIREAFGSGPGVEAALALHYSEVGLLQQRVNPPLLALLRETLPLRSPEET